MEMIENSINTGFYRPRNSNFLSSVDSIQELMLKLKNFDKNELKKITVHPTKYLKLTRKTALLNLEKIC